MKSLQEKLVIEQRNLLSLKNELLNLKSQAVGDFTKTPEYAAIMSSISDMSETISDMSETIADDLDNLEEETIPLMIRDALGPVNNKITNNKNNIQENSIITAGKGCCVELEITDRGDYILSNDRQSYSVSCTVESISAPRQVLLPGMAVLFTDEYIDPFGNPENVIRMGIISSYIQETEALTCRMVTRWEAIKIGNIIMSKETATSSANNTRHPELVVFTPKLTPLLDNGIYVKSPDIAIFVKQTYTPKTITGGNIYIQSNKPNEPNSVWIDTSGEDLILRRGYDSE